MQTAGVPKSGFFRLGKQRKPADPQAIMLRRARQRHDERLRDRDPESWGVSAEILKLPTSADVSVRMGERKRVIHAKRFNAFDLLHQARRGVWAGATKAEGVIEGRALSDEQHRAAWRYISDWCERFGVEHADQAAKVDRQTDGQGRQQRMIDAGKQIDRLHSIIGVMPTRVLTALVEPMVLGEIRVWQVIVKRVTGETDPHALAAMVRMACEALRLAYDEIDGVAPSPGDSDRRGPVRLWFAS
jgi:hypothetical protein